MDPNISNTLCSLFRIATIVATVENVLAIVTEIIPKLDEVFAQCPPQSTERVVQIKGPPQKVIECLNHIIEILKEIPIKGPTKPYESMFYDPSYSADYGGYPPDRNYRGPMVRGAAAMAAAAAGYGNMPFGRNLGQPIVGRGPLSDVAVPFMGHEESTQVIRFHTFFFALRDLIATIVATVENVLAIVTEIIPKLDEVFAQCPPQSTERVVQIKGPPQKVIECLNHIIEILKEIPIKGPTKPYESMFYDPSYSADYGGYPPDRNYRGPMVRGAAAMAAAAAGYGNMPFGRNLGQPIVGRGPLSDVAVPFMGHEESTQVTIPNELGGTIIGKGGERINRVREESGAQIIVGPHQDSGERIITITGTPAAIQTAQYLLQQW
ncbi:unnamed protein product [Gongylonema pulchrum]|uniref:KH domain-containing protein n=1 Tax=Gongylonema pulchrum TaxID=637853 RepID=A0A183DW17_9BILA|nr:unnamed protein product [Gongylonema pulchrum]